MENLLLLFATSLAWRISAPKFKRYLIGRTGCTSLLLSQETSLHIQSTKDGEQVYFYEHEANGATYGFITVGLKHTCTLAEAEEILTQYLNRIRQPFGICFHVGEDALRTGKQVSFEDYWQDEEGVDWKVKGLTNGKTVAVLYVKNIGCATVKDHDAFLNGFRFSSLT